MGKSITLLHFEREDIKVDVVARFEGDELIIDGYDIGKTVEEVWGDSDYEYVMTIPAGSLPLLYRLLGVEVGKRKMLLKAIAERFHGNDVFRLWETSWKRTTLIARPSPGGKVMK